MKNPVLAARVFLLAALSLVAALTLSARTDSAPSDKVAGGLLERRITRSLYVGQVKVVSDEDESQLERVAFKRNCDD